MSVEEGQFKTFLLDSGLVSRGDIEMAQSEAKSRKKSLGETLVSEGKISEDDLRRVTSYVLGIPLISLTGQKIRFETLSLIPEPIARRHNIVAYAKNDRAIEVAMLDIKSLDVVEFLKHETGLKVLPRLTDVNSIKHALLQYQGFLKQQFGDSLKQEVGSLGASLDTNNNESIIRIVDTIFGHAITQGASDIHLEPTDDRLFVRYRIDGTLHDSMVLPKSASEAIMFRVKKLAGLNTEEKRTPQEGRFKLEGETEKVSLRISTIPTSYGEKLVVRLLKEGGVGFTLEGLGFHGLALERVHGALKARQGMIVVSGPEKSGKTTLLYTLLDILNTPDKSISTIENPIEYQIPRVTQTRIRPDIGFSYVEGLRSIVRQDPDIVMVGDIQDTETATLSMSSASRHLILGGVTAGSSSNTIYRLLDLNVEPFTLVSEVRAIVSGKMLRRLAPNKESYVLSTSELDRLKKAVDLDKVLSVLKEEKFFAPDAEWESVSFYAAKQSSQYPDGYEGLVGAYEVLTMSPAIKELVVKGATGIQIEAQARKEGMMTLLEEGIFKAALGITSLEEVFRVIER